AWAANERLLEGVAAQVGDEIVLVSEVNEITRPMEKRMRDAGVGEAQIGNMHREALERLIDERLIANMVTRLEMGASEDEITQAVAGIAQSNGLTSAQLKASVENHGLTMEEYRAKLKGEIERNKIIGAMVSDRVRVTPEEIQVLFNERYGDQKDSGEEVRLRHILVGVGGSTMRDEKTACSMLAEAAAKIRAGQLDFNEAARQLTEMNPEQQGELGWLHLNEIAPWMVNAIRPLKPGEISDPISMPFGCNLLELVDERVFQPITLEQANASLRAELTNRKTDREIGNWLDEVRKQTFISRKGKYAESSQ
ncbi:MAG: peptidylprolyl isomerase, partial [Myxococcota bacterium]|nr:peptidylprolyl isomerase [Myxococcota bacterium]